MNTKSKTVLVTSLAPATLGLVSLVDTAGVLPLSSQFVSAQERVETRYLTAEEKAIDIKAEVVDDDHSVLKVKPKENFKGFLRGGETSLIPVVNNTDTEEVVWAYKGPEYGSIEQGKGFEDKWVVPRRRIENVSKKIPDGRYYIRLGVPNAVSLKSSDLGNSNVFTIKNGRFVKTETRSTPKPDEKPTPTPTVQYGWSGNSYYQNGQRVVNKWVFDVHYNSYYFINVNGNYVQNAWSGNYYLKSNGKMAKGEWIYDSNYKSYYYLTAEGSYARNTWVGNYYLKSNGKMAVNERTPDGYRVDASGKWIR